MDPLELAAPGLRLRPWRAADAADVARICADPEIGRCTSVPTPYTRADAEEWLAGTDGSWRSGRVASWAVTEAGSGALLGSVSLAGLDRDHPEVGFWCAPEVRGRGVTTAAVRAACAWALERGAPKVLWLAEVGNEASWRVAHRAGFAYEGRRLAECGHADGRRTDAWAASLVPGVEPEPWPYEPFAPLVDGDLTLRRWHVADAGALSRIEADPDVLGWAGPLAGDPRSVTAAALDVAGRTTEEWLLGQAARFAVCLAGEPVGGVSVRTPNPGTGEMGWWLGAAGRGRGVGTRAVRLAAAWGFGHLGLRRISAGIHIDNAASRALAARVGFVEEGVRRFGAPAFGPGWGDAVACGLLPADLR